MSAPKQTISYAKNQMDFEGVLQHELEVLRPQADLKEGPIEEACQANLSGLALSGGGIRSAIFNLGVIQGLAHMGILNKLDYLSTVSGGGYIGAWLTAWIRREIQAREEKAPIGQQKSEPKKAQAPSWVTKPFKYLRGLFRRGGDTDSDPRKTTDPALAQDGFDQVRTALGEPFQDKPQAREAAPNGHPPGSVRTEPQAIAHLRKYSNYLTPRRGGWSTDTWTLMVAYLRNLVLIVSILVGALASAVLIARGAITLNALMLKTTSGTIQGVVYGLFVASLAGAAYCVARELQRCRMSVKDKGEPAQCSPMLAWVTVGLTVVSLWWGTAVLWHQRNELLSAELKWSTGALFAKTIFIVFLAGAAGALISLLREGGDHHHPFKPRRLPAAIGGAVAFFLALWAQLLVFDHFGSYGASDCWLTVIWGPLLTLATLCVFAVIFVGLAGVDLGELEREWLARLLAAVSKWTVLFCLFTITLIYTPMALAWLKLKLSAWQGGILGALWAGICIAGAQLARAQKIAESKWGHATRKALMAVAPLIFIAGLLILLIAALDSKPIDALLFNQLHADNNNLVPRVTALSTLTCFGAGLLVLLVTYIWSWRVGVNTFSLHALYGNRLIRAFLGASNLERNAHPYTDFDPDDNEVSMSHLIPGESGYRGPYLIINAAINLVHTATSRLAWQQRKAGAFMFSPLYCGYEFPKTSSPGGHPGKGYVRSDFYADGKQSTKGISLGKAMTISGAAASPNMGYHSSPALAFLMTVFNVRLGWWLPNTCKSDPDLWAKKGPGHGLFYLLYELFGLTNDKRKYTYISDGGHFENLGIYELVRRRCRFVLACDAEADAKMQFSGLGNAIERCRTDFGIPIDIDLAQLRRDPATGRSQWHCAVGKIRYSQVHSGMTDGTLLYIKASLTGDEPQDTASYAAGHNGFPHQSTADQWFDETQFECYRVLGRHIVTQVMETTARVVRRNCAATALEPDRQRRHPREKEIADKDPNRVVQERRKKEDAEEAKKKHFEEIENNMAFMEGLFEELRNRWYPHTQGPKRSPGDHDAILGALLDTLRSDPLLAFLDSQLYPDLGQNFRKLSHERGGTPWVPASYAEMRAGFFYCARLIQFMQQVYRERKLDIHYNSPSHQGWMNLFLRWSLSRMVRYTWSMSAGTYSKRFQTFCTHHLRLEIGTLSWAKPLELNIRREGETFKFEPAIYQIDTRPEPGAEDDVWRCAERAFGLHFFETQLACEYLRNYCISQKNTRIPSSFQLFPLQITTEDPASARRDAFVAFTAGFAIVKPKKNQSQDSAAVLYLRIRPNMRRMKLAHKAMAELSSGNWQLPARVEPATIGNLVPSEEHWHRRIYLELYPMQHQSESREHIAKMINREIDAAAKRRLNEARIYIQAREDGLVRW